MSDPTEYPPVELQPPVLDDATPPPLTPPARPAEPPRARRCADLGAGFGPNAEPLTAARILDGLLKQPGRIAYAVTAPESAGTAAVLGGILALSALVVGAVMGTFAGGHQLWAVPLKVLAGLLFSAALCLPSLYILTSVAGGGQTFGQTAGLLLQALALTGLLLVLSWLCSPFLCKPSQRPHILPREYFQQNFYERVWQALTELERG